MSDIEPRGPGSLVYGGGSPASCTRCSWRGVPTKGDHRCPRCEVGPETDALHREARERDSLSGGQKVGRNDPCPCGSGKKAKKCHYK